MLNYTRRNCMQLYSVCPFTKRWMFHDAIYKDNLIVIINHLKQNRNLWYKFSTIQFAKITTKSIRNDVIYLYNVEPDRSTSWWNPDQIEFHRTFVETILFRGNFINTICIHFEGLNLSLQQITCLSHLINQIQIDICLHNIRIKTNNNLLVHTTAHFCLVSHRGGEIESREKEALRKI